MIYDVAPSVSFTMEEDEREVTVQGKALRPTSSRQERRAHHLSFQLPQTENSTSSLSSEGRSLWNTHNPESNPGSVSYELRGFRKITLLSKTAFSLHSKCRGVPPGAQESRVDRALGPRGAGRPSVVTNAHDPVQCTSSLKL